MKVPSRLVEKVLSALQIAKLSGDNNIKTGLIETLRAAESGKAKYIILALDTKPRNKKIQKKMAALKILAEESDIFCFEVSTQNELGKISGLGMGTSAIAIIKPDRAESIFKSVAKELKDEFRV